MKNANDSHEALVLIPLSDLLEIRDTLKFLKSKAIEKESSYQLKDWISEKDAMKLLGKKQTWFWNKRKSGELEYTKNGGTVIYFVPDINKLLEQNKRSAA